MRALGELWMEDGRASEARPAAGAACAPWMRQPPRATCWRPSCAPAGWISALRPVLDLDWGESGVIGDRAFAPRPARRDASWRKSLMHGLLQAGMANCGKHFPGHGFVKADSHVAMPVDKRSLTAILADDAAPYPWLTQVLTSVMPAHVIYPKVDSRPAGFSARWLQDILRGQLGFDGAIFSDDLSMEGARRIDGAARQLHRRRPGRACTRAAIWCCCATRAWMAAKHLDAAMAHVSEAVVKQQLLLDEASELRRRALLPTGPAPDWDELMCSSAYMQALDLLSELF